MSENSSADEPVPQPQPVAPLPVGVDAKVLELAKEPGASVAGIARKVHKSRDYIREILAAAGVELETQRRAAEKAPPAPVNAAEEIEHATDAAQADIEAAYAKQEATARLAEIHATGTILIDELAPLARARGRLTHELIRDALDVLAWKERLEAENAILLAPEKNIDIAYLVDYALAFVKQHHTGPDRVRVLETSLQHAADLLEAERARHQPLELARELAAIRALNAVAQG